MLNLHGLKIASNIQKLKLTEIKGEIILIHDYSRRILK